MTSPARRALEVGVGLTVLGVQRWMTVRRDVEDELDRIGLKPAATVSRAVGAVVGEGVGRLARLAAQGASPAASAAAKPAAPGTGIGEPGAGPGESR